MTPSKEEGKRKRRSPLLAHVASPVGHLLIGVTEKGVALVAGGHARPVKKRSAEHSEAQEKELENAIRELKQYFLGHRRTFTVKLDLSSGTPFQQKVWRELRRIPYGSTVTYGELARRVGRPRGARAVGQAVGSNPLGILVPCHRVVATNGIGGWSGGGGINGKRALLALEGTECRWERKNEKKKGKRKR